MQIWNSVIHKVWNNVNPNRNLARLTYAFIPIRKLVFNYMKSSGTHPSHKVWPHCIKFVQACQRENPRSEWNFISSEVISEFLYIIHENNWQPFHGTTNMNPELTEISIDWRSRYNLYIINNSMSIFFSTFLIASSVWVCSMQVSYDTATVEGAIYKWHQVPENMKS